jgi:hypothetical protein
MKAQRHFPDRRQQRGQAVLWFLATIAACCCVFALVYNVGQTTNEKEKTVNAADAAALSGALVEARTLNFEAYTNRAMVANEVTVAQLVSLDSWIRYDNEIVQYIAIYTEPIPYLDDATQAIAEVTQDATDGVDELVSIAIPGLEVENSALWLAREAANDAGLVAPNLVAAQIASANTTTFGSQTYDAELMPTFALLPSVVDFNVNSWKNFTDGYTGDGRANAKGVILNSRDPFSTKRTEGELIKLVNDAMEAAGLLASGGLGYNGFQKTSGTTTLTDYDHWAAQDSIDMTVSSVKFCFVVIPCGYNTHVLTTDAPWGYGRADADSNGETGDDLCYEKPSTTNCTLAVSNSNNIDWDGPEPNANGIPSLRDLAQGLAKTDPCTTNNGSDSPSLSFVAAVQKSGDATATTQRLGLNTVDVAGPQGSPKMADSLQNGDRLTSISAACTFFLRPDLDKKDLTQANLARADGVHEYASLYNPYWQARLTNPNSQFKQTLYVLIGNPGLDGMTPQPTNP